MNSETFKKIRHGVGQTIKNTILTAGTVAAPVTTHAVRTGSKVADLETWQALQADVFITVASSIPAFVHMMSMFGEPVDRIGGALVFTGMKFLTGLGGTGLVRYLESEYQKGLSGS